MVQNWIVAALAVVGAFYISTHLGALIGYRFGWSTLATSGFVTAFCVVMVAHYSAPTLKSEFTILVFVIGFGVSLLVLRPLANHLPLYATIAGGILALLLCLVAPPQSQK